MGKKAVIISGVVCIILVACLIPPIVKHFRIEGFVKDLHSNDEETQEIAINGLVAYGMEAIPYLLDEFNQQVKLYPDSIFEINNISTQIQGRVFDLGFIETFVQLGEESFQHLVEFKPNDESRFYSTVSAVILSFYGKLEYGEDSTLLFLIPNHISETQNLKPSEFNYIASTPFGFMFIGKFKTAREWFRFILKEIYNFEKLKLGLSTITNLNSIQIQSDAFIEAARIFLQKTE